MADKTAPIASEQGDTAEPPAAAAAPETARETAPVTRRTVTMPVLPLAIVGAVIVALVFFGGGVAVGFAIGHHPARVGVIQPFNNGHHGALGGRNGGERPNDRPTPTPENG